MNKHDLPEVTFSEPAFDVALEYVGALREKLQSIANEELMRAFGETAILNPTDMRLTVGMGIDEPMVTVESWHETTGEHPGVMQYNSYSAGIALEGENAVLKLDGREQPLTTREYLFLMTTSGLSMLKYLVEPPVEN